LNFFVESFKHNQRKAKRKRSSSTLKEKDKGVQQFPLFKKK